MAFSYRLTLLLFLTVLTSAEAEEKLDIKKFDVRKGGIERPVKAILVQRTANTTQRQSADPQNNQMNNSKSNNPKVVPGIVNWHPDIGKATAAAEKSKRPILLFQMIGRLDEQFT